MNVFKAYFSAKSWFLKYKSGILHDYIMKIMESVNVLDFVPNVLGITLNGAPGYTTLEHISTVCMLNHNKTINSTSHIP